MFGGEGEGVAVAGGELFGFAVGTAAPDGAGGVDDPAGGKAVAGRDAGFAGGAAHAGTDFGYRQARLAEVGARGAVDGAVHAAAAQHPLVRGVDDGIDGKGGDVGLDDFDHGFWTGFTRFTGFFLGMGGGKEILKSCKSCRRNSFGFLVEPVFAFELEGGGAKVEEEAVVDAGGGEVVDELGFVAGVEVADGLEFEDEAAVDDDVRLVMPDADAVVTDVEGDLFLSGEVLFGEFQEEGVLVDFFEEAGAEAGVDRHGGADDGMGQFVDGHGMGLLLDLRQV